MDGDKLTPARQSKTWIERQRAFEETTKFARETVEEERRRREEKNARLRAARLAKMTPES